ncbi:bromodomain-containing protein [Cystoisospora suis]|uniref:Bromodomain-containing protein n=1 Tax=Cystoisospora suis TaxID=483139 RepID=A0A2C6KHI0_9APIC|nr:bromodomain-containing protein [Cystoisospora suis]
MERLLYRDEARLPTVIWEVFLEVLEELRVRTPVLFLPFSTYIMNLHSGDLPSSLSTLAPLLSHSQKTATTHNNGVPKTSIPISKPHPSREISSSSHPSEEPSLQKSRSHEDKEEEDETRAFSRSSSSFSDDPHQQPSSHSYLPSYPLLTPFCHLLGCLGPACSLVSPSLHLLHPLGRLSHHENLDPSQNSSSSSTSSSHPPEAHQQREEELEMLHQNHAVAVSLLACQAASAYLSCYISYETCCAASGNPSVFSQKLYYSQNVYAFLFGVDLPYCWYRGPSQVAHAAASTVPFLTSSLHASSSLDSSSSSSPAAALGRRSCPRGPRKHDPSPEAVEKDEKNEKIKKKTKKKKNKKKSKGGGEVDEEEGEEEEDEEDGEEEKKMSKKNKKKNRNNSLTHGTILPSETPLMEKTLPTSTATDQHRDGKGSGVCTPHDSRLPTRTTTEEEREEEESLDETDDPSESYPPYPLHFWSACRQPGAAAGVAAFYLTSPLSTDSEEYHYFYYNLRSHLSSSSSSTHASFSHPPYACHEPCDRQSGGPCVSHRSTRERRRRDEKGKYDDMIMVPRGGRGDSLILSIIRSIGNLEEIRRCDYSSSLEHELCLKAGSRQRKMWSFKRKYIDNLQHTAHWIDVAIEAVGVLMELPEAVWFIPDPETTVDYYRSVIQEPMWLKKVQAKLKARLYKLPYHFKQDVALIFRNARTFNRPEDRPYRDCCVLEQKFNRLWGCINQAFQRDAAIKSYKTSSSSSSSYSSDAVMSTSTSLSRQQSQISSINPSSSSSSSSSIGMEGLERGPPFLSSSSAGGGEENLLFLMGIKEAQRASCLQLPSRQAQH